MRRTSAATVLFLAALLFPVPATAQPGWGLAADDRGQLYFCDIERDQVWKLDPQGNLTLLLTQTHCHNLVPGYDGNIYGEDIGGESRGGGIGTGVGLWKLTPEGELTYLLPLTTNPEKSLWIVRDLDGNTYAAYSDPQQRVSQILKRSPEGTVSVLAGGVWGQADGRGSEARFGHIGGLAVAPDGVVYVADSGNLRRISPDGTVTTLACQVVSQATGGLPGNPGLYNHSMGVAVDARNDVYVVDYRNRRVVRRSPDSVVITVARSRGIANRLTGSEWGWMPTGIAVRGEELYLLETWPMPILVADLLGNPRLRKILPSGEIVTVASVASWQARLALALLAVGLILAIWRWRRRSRRATAVH